MRKGERQDQRFVSAGRLMEQRHNAEKLTWVRVPVKMVSLTRKRCTIEKWRQEQNGLFWRGDYIKEDNKPERTVIGSDPGEDIFCTLKTNDCRKIRMSQALFILARRLQVQLPHLRRKCPGSELW
jgi:hypothetical protein